MDKYTAQEFIDALVKRGICRCLPNAKQLESKLGKTEYTEDDFIEVYRMQENVIRNRKSLTITSDGRCATNNRGARKELGEQGDDT